MDFHVFDTYVKAKDGHNTFWCNYWQQQYKKTISFAKEWLKSIKEESVKITTEECRFCHTQSVPKDVEIEIMTNDYFISKMEGCPE